MTDGAGVTGVAEGHSEVGRKEGDKVGPFELLVGFIDGILEGDLDGGHDGHDDG